MAVDYELKDFLGDWQAFLRQCSKDRAYIDSEEFGQRAKFLVDRSQALGRDKYAQPFNEVIGLLQQFVEGWRADPLTAQIGAVLQRLVSQDILGQTDGPARSSFFVAMMRPDLMQDFRHVLLPSMLRNLHEIALPRIESVSDGDRLVLENIVIPAGGFIPVDLDVRQASTLRMSPRERLIGTIREKVRKARSGWSNTLRIRMYCLVLMARRAHSLGRECRRSSGMSTLRLTRTAAGPSSTMTALPTSASPAAACPSS
jgi:hypothetical protein